MSRSTYFQVRELVDVLIETKAVVKRRAAGTQLQEMLSRPEIRQRLALEAEGGTASSSPHQGCMFDPSRAVRRRRTLSEMWRMIVRGAVLAVNDIATGKSKLSLGDITMLYKIIQACDMGNEGFENAYSTTKLSRREVKSVTKLCLALLEDDYALQIAELQLLELLAFPCSRREYVAHFRPQPELQIILEEVEKRLLAEEDSLTRGTRDVAAKLFANVIHTSDDLHMSLHLILSDALKLVSNWCSQAIKRDNLRHVSELSDLFNGVTTLLYSNPEQAVAPLTREGKAILSFAKRRYANADETQRHALNRYFQCHM